LRRNAIDCGLEKTGGPHALLCRKLSTPRAPTWYAIPLRLIVGWGFIEHGCAKLARGPDSFAAILHAIVMPMLGLLAWTTIMVELIGGFVALIGALIPLASIPMAVVHLVAIFTVHIPNGFSSIKLQPFVATSVHFGQPGYETDLLYVAGLVALMLGGSGPLALHRLLLRHSDEASARPLFARHAKQH
jgi:putative oxidoreductase